MKKKIIWKDEIVSESIKHSLLYLKIQNDDKVEIFGMDCKSK
jgi:hypothetical protein